MGAVSIHSEHMKRGYEYRMFPLEECIEDDVSPILICKNGNLRQPLRMIK
jgi:hypothetical protein